MSRYDALLLFENGVTPDGRRVNDIAFEEFEPAIREYWQEHPSPEARVGRVYVTETEQGRPRWLIHCPVSADWTEEAPLHTIIRQLRVAVRKAKELGASSIAAYAVDTDLLHEDQLRGMMRELLAPTEIAFTILPHASRAD